MKAGIWGTSLVLMFVGCTASPRPTTSCLLHDAAPFPRAVVEQCSCEGSVEEVVGISGQPTLDVLFVIDNSRSMSLKQQALTTHIPEFFRSIEASQLSYHVAVVTTDVGSTTAEGADWPSTALSLQECNTFAGDDGRMQVQPCTKRKNLSPDAKNACAALCTKAELQAVDSVTTDGRPYIVKLGATTNVPADWVPDPDRPGKLYDQGPSRAFQCMAVVGDGGCALEAPLEAAKRALDGHIAAQSGFLRPSSILAIVFISDEDDCSVQAARRYENTPEGYDCPSPDLNARTTCWNANIRCTAGSLECDQPLNTPGLKSNCREKPGSYLEPVDRYFQFFSSLRPAERLLIAGIWTPKSQSSMELTMQYGLLGPTSQGLELTTTGRSACRYAGSVPAYSTVSGYPQRRLSDFASRFGTDRLGNPNALELSVCDVDRYPEALSRISAAVRQRIPLLCLDDVQFFDSNTPLCTVGDVPADQPASVSAAPFPLCSAVCCAAWQQAESPSPQAPAIVAACLREQQSPCACVVKSTQSSVCPGRALVGVWRTEGSGQPVGTLTKISCVRPQCTIVGR